MSPTQCPNKLWKLKSAVIQGVFQSYDFVSGSTRTWQVVVG